MAERVGSDIYRYDDLEYLENITMDGLYDFAFNFERKAQIKKAKKFKKFVPTHKINLPKLLEAFGDYVPDNRTYKHICMFLSMTDVDPVQAGKLCNKAWNPRNTAETKRFIEKYR